MPGWSKIYRAKFKKFLRGRKQYLLFVPAIFILCLLSVLSSCLFFNFGKYLDFTTANVFFPLKDIRDPSPEVALAVRTDKTYSALDLSPRLPFPRKVTARVIEKISSVKPKMIIIDGGAVKEDLDPEGDLILADAIRSAPVTIFSGATPASSTVEVDKLVTDRGQFINHQSNDKKFEEAARMTVDMWFLFDYDGHTVYKIAANDSAIASDYQSFPLLRPLKELGGYSLEAPGKRDLINYYGPAGTVKQAVWEDIVNADEEFLKNHFAGKVVLFGYKSAVEDRERLGKDEFGTPLDPMYGVEIHANVVSNLIDKSWIKRFNPFDELTIILFISLSITPFFRQILLKHQELPARSGADWRAQAQRRQLCLVQHG